VVNPEFHRLLESARGGLRVGSRDEAERLLSDFPPIRPSNSREVLELAALAAEAGGQDVAIALVEQVLQLEPNNPQAIVSIARLLMRTERKAEASQFAEKAVVMSSGHPKMLMLLSETLFREQKFEESLEALERRLARMPDDVPSLYAKARLLEELARQGEAVDAYRRATTLAPNPEGLLRLGNVCLTLGLLDESIDACRRSLEMRPDNGIAHLTLAKAYAEAGRLAEAEPLWVKARTLGLDEERVRYARGAALLQIGEFEEAADEIKSAIQINPEVPKLFGALFMTGRVEESERPFVEMAARLAEKPDLPDRDRIELLYGLGKACDNLGEYENAIRWFDEANALMRRVRFNGKQFNREEFSRGIDARIKVFTPELLGRAPEVGFPSTLPIVIAGEMRSGTTLLEQILTCHPQVGGAGEQTYWPAKERILIDAVRARLRAPAFAQLGREYCAVLESAAPGYPRVAEKNPANALAFGTLHMGLPNAKIIHTRRHPVDTALSVWMTEMHTDAPFAYDREAIVYAFQEADRLMEHWRTVLPAGRFMAVDYEDLISEPERVTRQIVEFLELEWSEACLHPELNRRTVRTPSLWQVRQPLYKTSLARWKNYEPWLGSFRGLMPKEDL
jgi:tetratricopeptide (TPR) repeat protein